LYRKYRPRSFSDVTGQAHITETLKRQVDTDRVSHAYLFVGTRGTGKTSCAKILARAINCLSPISGDPCNTCASCIGIEDGSILDVLELEAASNNRVENIRDLLDEAIYSPASVKKRVYIVDEVHMLSPAAFNALLQILEEPPKYLMFVLATTELHKVPATILSRCQKFSFKRLSSDLIASRLSYVAEQEGLTLTDEALEKLATLADGSMRDGLSLLDQCTSDTLIDLKRVLDTVGLSEKQELLRLTHCIAVKDVVSALEILNTLYEDGRDMAALMSELATLMRDLLVSKLSASSPLLSGGFSQSELSGLSAQISPERLFANLEVIRETSAALSRGASVKITTEMCFIRLCDERLSDDIPAMLARIEQLESRSPATGMIHTAENNNTHMHDTVSEIPADERSVPEDAAFAVAEEPEDFYDHRDFEATEEAFITHAPHDSSDDFARTPSDSEDFDRSEYAEQSEDSDCADNSAQPSDTAQASPDSSETDFWDAVLNELKSDVPIYSLLSDCNEISAQLKDNTLIISARNPFTVAQIESKLFLDALKEAAAKALNRDMIIRTCAADSIVSESKHDKLEKLVDQFSIVNFE